jgi:hypothetical protein
MLLRNTETLRVAQSKVLFLRNTLKVLRFNPLVLFDSCFNFR